MAEKIEGFYLNGTEYEIGGAEYNAGQGISIGEWQICTTESDRKGPAPSGFHVPPITEWQGVKTIMDGLSLTTGDSWRINLHMPFAGYRDPFSSAIINSQGSYGYYWSSSPYGSSRPTYACNIALFSSSEPTDDYYERSSGFSVRCFKNSYVTPDSSWTVVQGTLGSAGIFWNQSKGLISITDGTTGYTIMDKNLGATTVYNNGDTLTQANMGNMYQWGNNYGFQSTGIYSKTSETQVDASGYGPSTANGYYEDDTFITGMSDWSSVINDDLWGDTSNGTHQECGELLDNVISNTGVLSVNGQTGNVTVQSGSEASGVTTTQPSNPVAGSTYYDTTAGTLKVYNGTSWVEVGGGNVIAMTQAEYDALPEATKNDGKLRIITDATGIEMADKAYVDGLVGDIETLLAAL